MAILSEWELSKEATWEAFVQWAGLTIGTWPLGEVEQEAAIGAPEIMLLAYAELLRRLKLEAP
jgi:hypothetical protein